MIGVVVNPVSGGGRGRALAEQVEALFRERRLEARRFESKEAGGYEAAVRRALAEGCDAICCLSGDGSLSEAMQTLVDSGATLYLVPSGTGNDFARALKLPGDPIQALTAQLDGLPCAIDCGTINGKAFMNVSGSGFDVDVLRRTEELKSRYPGEKAYRKAVLDVIGHFKPFCPEIEIDGVRMPEGRYTIVEVANGQCIGGGMKVAPNARPNDGLFDVVLVRAVPRMAIPLLLPLFILGWHVHLPLARVIRAKRVVLRASGMTLNIDGQLVRMDSAAYEILPGALHMRLPK